MGVQTFPAPAAPSGLNAGEVFTTSGSWTVPAGVVFAHVILRGGDGGYAAATGMPSNNNQIVTAGTAGGNTVAFSTTANGGLGGQNYARSQAIGGGGPITCVAHGQGPTSGVAIETIVAVTPGATETITVGSGTGAHVSIRWSA